MPPLPQDTIAAAVISLQCPYDQIDLRSLSGHIGDVIATSTILREPYKIRFEYVEGHAVLRSREQLAMLSKLTIRQNLCAVRSRLFAKIPAARLSCLLFLSTER
jgi:hypothetical protein